MQGGTIESSAVAERMRDILLKAGVNKIDYAVVVDADTLGAIDQIDRPAVALIAVRLGSTRLIDNALLNAE